MKAENFGKNLLKAIELLEMNQEELANKANVTPAAISQIINNKRVPSLETVCAILNVIPVNFEWLTRD